LPGVGLGESHSHSSRIYSKESAFMVNKVGVDSELWVACNDGFAPFGIGAVGLFELVHGLRHVERECGESRNGSRR